MKGIKPLTLSRATLVPVNETVPLGGGVDIGAVFWGDRLPQFPWFRN